MAITVMSNCTPYLRFVLFEANYILCGLVKGLEGKEDEICIDRLSVVWWHCEMVHCGSDGCLADNTPVCHHVTSLSRWLYNGSWNCVKTD